MVETLFTRHGVENNIAIRQGSGDVVHDQFTDAPALAGGVNRTVVNRGLVGTVRNRPAETDQAIRLIDEHGGVTGLERALVHVGFVVGHADLFK